MADKKEAKLTMPDNLKDPEAVKKYYEEKAKKAKGK
jgi:hypothetical protein